jgi:hypothetical protein
MSTVTIFSSTGNLLQIVATFTPTVGNAAPNAAIANFTYYNLRGIKSYTTIPLVLQSDGTWTQSWSLGNVAPGSFVVWVVSCSGPLVAATNGIFEVAGATGPGTGSCTCSWGC